MSPYRRRTEETCPSCGIRIEFALDAAGVWVRVRHECNIPDPWILAGGDDPERLDPS